MSTSSISYDSGVKKSGTFGKAMSQTLSNTYSTDNSLVIQLFVIILLFVLVAVLYQINIKGIADDFADVKWGTYQFDPVKGQTVVGEDGAYVANENASSFKTALFGSTGTLVMLFINLITFMFGGSRDLVYMFRRWMPNLHPIICNIIAISPIIIHIAVIALCTIAIRSDQNSVGAYFYGYSITAIVISALCCTATWLRFYWERKVGGKSNWKVSIILTIVNVTILVYACTLLGYYASTSDDVKTYLKTRATANRSLH